MIGALIAERALDWIGVPYQHCAWSRFGCDCTGLLLGIAHELGLTDWVPTSYSRSVAKGQLRENLERFCTVVQDGEPMEPGDVVLFEIRGVETHVAIWIGDGTIVHSMNGTKSVARHGYAEKWQKRARAVYRWRAA